MLRKGCMHHQQFAGKRREGTKKILEHIRSLVLTIFKATKAEKPVCTCILLIASNHCCLACISCQDL
jgi:hypothetical protein